MSLQIQLKKSAVSQKQPFASDLAVGELALNYNADGPFLTCKDTAGNVRKLNNVWVGTTAPTGPSAGDLWLDTTATDAVLKVYEDSVTGWVNATTIPLATTSVFGTVRLASATDVANGTSGKIVDAAQLQSKITSAFAQEEITLNDVNLLGDLVVAGDLTVSGTTTTISSETLLVEDKNIEMGVVETPTDTTADGGGLTLKGATDKTLNWVNATDSWTSSENIDLASGKSYRINDVEVLSATALGSAVQISSANIPSGTIVDSDINAAAEIAVSKLADGAARQLLQTDAAGNGVEWTSNVDVPGTLDVTGAATFDSSVAVTGALTKSGNNVVTVGDTGTVTSAMIANNTIVNEDINASAGIVDTKLATISTAGKVSNSATTATSSNTANAIVTRDGSGDFSAGAITASLTGNADTATKLNSNRTFAVTGDVVGTVSSDLTSGASISTSIASGVIVDADINASAEIAVSKLADGAARQLLQTDAAGTGVEWTSNVDIPGTLDVTGAATFDSSVAVTGTLTKSGNNVVTVGDTGTVTSTMIANNTIINEDINASAAIADTKLGTISTAGKVSNSATTATSANTASAIVARDASGNFTAGTVTASLAGNANTATKLNSTRTFAVTGDITGTVSSDLTSGASISTSIASGVIVDADINASAAIAGTKISPDFGSQNVTTTGTSTAASFIPTSSTVPTNGVYLPAANSVALSTNGTGRLFIDASGEVGIGNSAPAYQLDLNKTGSNTLFGAGIGADVDGADHALRLTAWGATGGRTGSIRFFTGSATGGSEKLRITSAGLVGIGTSSPGSKLEIANGAIKIGADNSGQSQSTNSLILESTDTSVTTGQPIGRIEYLNKDAGGNGRVVLESFATDDFGRNDLRISVGGGGGDATSTAVTVTPQSRVGIGTTSPNNALSFAATAGTAGTTNKIDLFNNGQFGFGISIGTLNYCSSENHTFYNLSGGVNTERVRIDSSGRLLVGTSTSTGFDGASAKLQVENPYVAASFVSRTNDIYGSTLFLAKSRGSGATIVQSGDAIGGISFNGADGSDLQTSAAYIQAFVDGTPGFNDMPGRLVFSTTSDGSASPTERLRINNSGAFGVAGANFGSAGQVLVSNGSSAAPSWENVTPSAVFGWDHDNDTYGFYLPGTSIRTGALSGTVDIDVQSRLRRCVINDSGVVQYYLDADDSTLKAGDWLRIVETQALNTAYTGTHSESTNSLLRVGVPAWSAGTFTRGQRVTNGGYLWECIAASTTATPAAGTVASDLTGTDGQVMVEVPAFSVRYGYLNGVHTREVRLGCNDSLIAQGFQPHPAFIKTDGTYKDAFYIGAYQVTGTSPATTVSGANNRVSMTRATQRSASAARGTGWHVLSYLELAAIQTLMVTEFRDMNTQRAIGNGAQEGAVYAVNTGLSNAAGNRSQNAYTSGGAVTDYISYRGLENIYGRAWQFVDGFNVYERVVYLTNDQTAFADNTSVGYNFYAQVPTGSSSYQKELFPLADVFLPSVVTGASSTTYLGDALWTSTGWRVAFVGGPANDGAPIGAFALYLTFGSGGSNSAISARLAYAQN